MELWPVHLFHFLPGKQPGSLFLDLVERRTGDLDLLPACLC